MANDALKPIKDTGIVSGVGGYGWNLSQKDTRKAVIRKKIELSDELSYKEMTTAVSEVVKDA